MTKKQAKALSEMLLIPMQDIRRLDTLAREQGFRHLLELIQEMLKFVFLKSLRPEDPRFNKEVAEVAAYIRTLRE